ncbi:MAG: hypothetical protein ACOYXB_10850 [Bacteroidota bacterium]
MKTKKSFFVLLVSAIFLLSALPVQAQNQTSRYLNKYVEVTLNDGNILIGQITSDSEDEIVLQSATFGEMVISRKNVSAIKNLEEKQASGKFGFENPNPSKYLIGQSGIPMEKGSVSYQNVWIFLNSFTYSPVEFFSITGGFEIISMFFGADGPYFYMLNPKVNFKVIDRLYLGGNILYVNSIRTTTSFSGLATLNAFATYGTADYNATAGVGWGWVEGNFSQRPVITIAGMARVTKGLGFVSENWMIPGLGEDGGYYRLYSLGLRFISQKSTIDLAFVNNADIFKAIFIGIPYLDFVVKF